MEDPTVLELVAKCVATTDDGLSPLVAAGLVDAQVVQVFLVGIGAKLDCEFPRTAKAIEIVKRRGDS